MSTKSDYTQDEWQLLLDVPPAIGTAVMYAGQSGIGSMKEAMAMASSILGARNGYEGNRLVEALIHARLKEGEKSQIETLGLWTFQANLRAQAFYRQNGFVEDDRTDGDGNDEKLPDVHFTWVRKAND